MKTKISIVIIVRNDRGIANTLIGLEKQRKPAATEIVVVDSSNPTTLADIRAQHPDVLWYEFKPANPDKTSIPEQRNFGVSHAHGDIIVFIDANCIPLENWLVEMTRPILDGDETMTAGPVKASDPKKQLTFQPIGLKNGYVSASPTINLAFTKAVWEKVGGFDEAFLFGSDIDFTWRCIDAGNKIRFISKAFITHDWGDLHEQVTRSFKYGKARARLIKKHPERRYQEFLNENVILTVYTLYLVGLPITILFLWYPLTIGVIMLKNINNKPLKTVTSNLIYTLGFWIGIAAKNP